ncbi:MAG: hypothetical protein EXR72_25870 [Myxococcales bacterium]|nr:hypothetical protein [Myxococcales bacterium]
MKSYRLILVFALLVPAACGPSGSTSPRRDLPDQAAPLPDLFVGCKGGAKCPAETPLCDPKTGQCVACLGDENCRPGLLCGGGRCMPGCSAGHACGDGGGTCDLDGGVCRTCAIDADCADPKRARCEVATQSCVPCLPDGDNCPQGTYCARAGNVWGCAAGCAKDDECKARAPDGGAATAACCDHVCVDTARNSDHCAGCGMACHGALCCASACLDVLSDIANCGACGKMCGSPNATPACALGKCVVGMCQPGFGDCNKIAADGCEVNIDTDPKNCLGCGVVCAAPRAVAGCAMGCFVAQCDPGFGDCDKKFGNGCEADLQNGDLNNCGGCGIGCVMGAHGITTCKAGQCAIASCNGAFKDCNQMYGDGCEADSASDPMHCGGCGKVCPAPNGIATCAMGVCGLGGCKPGFKDCNGNAGDGCEVNIGGDIKNCGGCGVVCGAVKNGTPGCVSGACRIAACNAPFLDCNGSNADGCEVDSSGNLLHCGGCGKACPAVANGAGSCSGGACAIASCKAGFKDCNKSVNDGCEIDTTSDAKNCGGCNLACANGQTCLGGACVAASLTVGVMGGGFYADELRAYLATQPLIASATQINSCAPNILAQYKVVILYGNMTCFDAAAFNAYVQNGGGLIATPWIHNNNSGLASLPVAMNGGSIAMSSVALNVTVVDPNDVLLQGVGFVNGNLIGYEEVPFTLRNGATNSVLWKNNPNLMAVAKWGYGAGRAVYLDFHYITSDCARATQYAWGKQLVYNSVLWAGKLK